VFVLPDEAGSEKLKNIKIRSREGEVVLASARLCAAMLLSWGSQIEEDLRNFERSGKAHGKMWLAAPVFPLAQIPEDQTTPDVETGEKISVRQIIVENRSHLYLFLPPFPKTADELRDLQLGIPTAKTRTEGELGRYLDLRKMTTLPIQYFTDAKDKRLVGLHDDGLNSLYSRLMWFFTRAEYFFRPVVCQRCGSEVELDLRFEGQNIDAEPWG
jgi:hypothetical protein